jgi:kumamolisin
MAYDRHVALEDSERRHPEGVRVRKLLRPEGRMDVSVRLRPRNGWQEATVQELGGRLPHDRQHLSREEFEERHGAHGSDLREVARFAHAHGLTVVEAETARRTVVLAGSAAAFSRAFAVRLRAFHHRSGAYRGHEGPVQVPSELAGMVEGVLGLDSRQQVVPHFRLHSWDLHDQAPRQVFTPVQLARLYDFPLTSGAGESIAILQFGGGYLASDLDRYFKELGLPHPEITSVSVDNCHNQPTGKAHGPDGEVLLDIEVAGAVAPGARFTIYFAPNDERGVLDAVTKAVHDKHRRPSIISTSWGQAECTWSARSLKLINAALQEAAMLGITVCAASGDGGSRDGIKDGKNHVDFPASSPYALACGGTRMHHREDKIAGEIVWKQARGATGGGVSDIFDLPEWQRGMEVPRPADPPHARRRGVPDVAANAVGYRILVCGKQHVITGTSAVAPLWAALIARLNENLGKPVGYVTPLLYTRLAKDGLRAITQGDNGAYSAGQGWNACTGLGSPRGSSLAHGLARRIAA